MNKLNEQIYNGEIVAGSLLIPESRHIAQRLIANADEDAWHQAVVIDNVLQKRTPATAKRQAGLIKNRLSIMQPALWEMIYQGSNDVATQALLAAAIKHSRLLGDFMDQVIRTHWKTYITKISSADWNSFIEMCIQKDSVIETWTDSTRAKLKQVVFRILAESKYVDGIPFVKHLQDWLDKIAKQVARSFPKNEYAKIINSEISVKKALKRKKPEGLDRLESLIAERLEPVSILDVLATTQKWLHWDQAFGPLSGHDTKLENPSKSNIYTTFCYGCGLGPTQSERSIKEVSRRQLAWINQRHVTEEKLNNANSTIINEYNLFELIKLWGSGKSASADGTKWELYEQNLLSEYHIRYGGYGGIGYYHVSDTYIALFSNFIPCGVHEGTHILDVFKDDMDMQPDTLHGDTHAQSEVVFGLSYLLGIKLMPRIKNWKHLTFYHPNGKNKYPHIEEVFSDECDLDLIMKHLPDMYRVALSIKEGRITASAILRRLLLKQNSVGC